MEEDIAELEIIITTIRKILQKEIKDTTEDVYTIDGRQFKAIENLLTRYKQLEKENKELKRKSDRDEILQDISDDFIKAYKRNTIPKSKVKEKIEELKKEIEELQERFNETKGMELCNAILVQIKKRRETIKALQELLRE